ncbi:hypothetical protein FB567DRAFT_583662 [Paraphoma chrysanthemicola]|uniref:Uncharacterized protein n=1 Tax=Paraphoma chrysanthemicola TaxID=798071 RepID=A0A8K0QW42_9PLEO|nr:hypothetical protein FB567DRAFT_583662 [Paraphoma chrysanthemicola]
MPSAQLRSTRPSHRNTSNAHCHIFRPHIDCTLRSGFNLRNSHVQLQFLNCVQLHSLPVIALGPPDQTTPHRRSAAMPPLRPSSLRSAASTRGRACLLGEGVICAFVRTHHHHPVTPVWPAGTRAADAMHKSLAAPDAAILFLSDRCCKLSIRQQYPSATPHPTVLPYLAAVRAACRAELPTGHESFIHRLSSICLCCAAFQFISQCLLIIRAHPFSDVSDTLRR